MPACFTLTPIGAETPEKLSAIDDAMRVAFGAEPDPAEYYQRWVDCEGLALAMGKDWNWMRENFEERTDIINWLAANYTPDAFFMR